MRNPFGIKNSTETTPAPIEPKRLINLYQMWDIKSATSCGPIMGVKKEGAAVRSFTDALATKDIQLHAEDYVLLHLGYQDEDTGDLHPMIPSTVFSGKTWLEYNRAAAQASAVGSTAQNGRAIDPTAL